jgi:hypothetical protein
MFHISFDITLEEKSAGDGILTPSSNLFFFESYTSNDYKCSRRGYVPILQCPQARGSEGLAENLPEGFLARSSMPHRYSWWGLNANLLVN